MWGKQALGLQDLEEVLESVDAERVDSDLARGGHVGEQVVKKIYLLCGHAKLAKSVFVRPAIRLHEAGEMRRKARIEQSGHAGEPSPVNRVGIAEASDVVTTAQGRDQAGRALKEARHPGREVIDELGLRYLEAPLLHECLRKRFFLELSALKELHSPGLMPSCEDLFVREVWEKPRQRCAPGGLDEDATQVKQNDLASRLHADGRIES